ncbi:hypothetical protein [Histophilus somni]|uniref:hypothetical protein n=1 Tax=Histophilus somni TaxID=731 RepID=UPI00201F9E18|nr:hypothetical protein [Histophilus somni]
MKSIKFSLLTLASIIFSGNSFAASDEELIPYLESSANTYLKPYISRDLGKEIKIKSDPYAQIKLKLVIPNASCDEYFETLTKLSLGLYRNEFIIDRLEENQHLTVSNLTEPMGEGRFFEAAAQLLATDIQLNPVVISTCSSAFKTKGENDPVVIKIKGYFEKLTSRIEKLKQLGRLK